MLILAYDENDNIVHIKDAEKGKSYKCPDCGAEVRPRKGTKKTHHFFHMNAEDCGNSGESIVHKYYKEFIASQKTVQYNGIEMTVTNSKIEQTLPNLLTNSHIIADVMLELNGYKWIAVEVCYKNHKDENHVDIYNTLDMECFEVYVDMNEKQTDFEITGYKKIASIEQYGEKIKTETIQFQDEINSKTLQEKDNKIKEYDKAIVTICDDVLEATGYYMSWIINNYLINNTMYNFVQLMDEIDDVVKVNNITEIQLHETKDNGSAHNSFGCEFDIYFLNGEELIHSIKNIKTLPCKDGRFTSGVINYSSQGSHIYGSNAFNNLKTALEYKYTYLTKMEKWSYSRGYLDITTITSKQRDKDGRYGTLKKENYIHITTTK